VSTLPQRHCGGSTGADASVVPAQLGAVPSCLFERVTSSVQPAVSAELHIVEDISCCIARHLPMASARELTHGLLRHQRQRPAPNLHAVEDVYSASCDNT